MRAGTLPVCQSGYRCCYLNKGCIVVFLSTENELPLQLYHLTGDGVRCYRVAPADHLQTWIYYYWWLEVAPGNTTIEVIPDNAVDLVMSPEIEQFSILYLPASEKFIIPLNGPIVYVGISFRAGFVGDYFNISQDVMRDLTPGENTTTTLSITELVRGVQELEQPDQLAIALNNLVSARLSHRQSNSGKATKLNVDKALAAMQASVGMNGMEDVAEQFGLSDRQFRRIMSSLFGYGPKKVQRVMRLQSSLKEIFASELLAEDDGFFDEAHKIKEVRALTGLTPGQIRKMAEIYNSML